MQIAQTRGAITEDALEMKTMDDGCDLDLSLVM